MKKQYLYIIVVLMILVIAVAGWYYFSSVGSMLWPGDGGGCVVGKDSCVDSDGGLAYTKAGYVAGCLNGKAYNIPDDCGGLYSWWLREYYCTGKTYSRVTINCNASGYFNCNGGRCK